MDNVETTVGLPPIVHEYEKDPDPPDVCAVSSNAYDASIEDDDGLMDDDGVEYTVTVAVPD